MAAQDMQRIEAYRYAGFWLRFAARLIDGTIVGILGLIITLPLTFRSIGSAISVNRPAALSVILAMLAVPGFASLIRLALGFAYEVYFLSIRGATPGKLALGLKVIRTDDGPISAGLAIGRCFGLVLSAMFLMFGYFIAAIDPQKRSLHDRICNTYVIYAKVSAAETSR